MNRFKVYNFAGQIGLMLNVDTSVIIVIGYIYIYRPMQSKPFLVLYRNFLQVKMSYSWRQYPPFKTLRWVLYFVNKLI